MKLRRCFIDEHGNIWRDSTLIKASKDLKEQKLDLNCVSLDEVIRWKIVNLRDYINHYGRVQDADCSIPIILRSDGYPMDGWHRIIKANCEGMVELPCKQFDVDPPPDFKPDI